MLSESDARRVYLACGNTDLRKSIDGLAALVREGFNLDPFSPCLFVFCNHRRDKIKILEWDHNGFWLLSGLRDKSHYPDCPLIPKIAAIQQWPV